jgi:hypothetical protein
MALPINAVPAGGFGLEAQRLQNALLKQRLENQYYGPSMESDINNKNAMTKGQNIQNEYMPEKMKLANQYQGLQNQFYAPNMQSEINNRNALTNKYNTMTPLEAQELKIKNQFAPQREQSNIEAQKAMANYRNNGGPGMGVGQKQIAGFQQQLKTEHPDWTPQQVNQAASAYLVGDNQLQDGTQLPPLSGIGQSYADQITKQGTTAPILTSNIKANQAEAELQVLNDYAQKGLEPYGDTYLNMSPQQIKDSFKKDDASQQRLGKFVASQALQYEAAQNRIKLANGQPGVTSTEELMRISGQMVNTKFPELSYKARKEAARYLDEALREGLKARQSVKIGAASTRGSPAVPKANKNMEHLSDEELMQIIQAGS